MHTEVRKSAWEAMCYDLEESKPEGLGLDDPIVPQRNAKLWQESIEAEYTKNITGARDKKAKENKLRKNSG